MQNIAAAASLCTPPDLRPLAREVLGALAEVRFASTVSLLAYAGPSGLTVEILDDWCAAGLLHRDIVRTDPVNRIEVPYVALAPRGARALADATGHEAHGITVSKLKQSTQKRAHDLAVGDFGLAVLSLARQRAIELLRLELDDRRLTTSITTLTAGERPERVPLQADAYVLVKTEEGVSALLVEVDRGTTAIARMGRKYAAYLAWKQSQGPARDFAVKAMRVLTVAPDERRSGKLHDAALEANNGVRSGFLLFANAADVTPVDSMRLMQPVARPLGHDARLQLFTPCSGLRDPQVVAASGGNPPGREQATRSHLGITESQAALSPSRLHQRP